MKSIDVTTHCPECNDIVFSKSNDGKVTCATCGHKMDLATSH